MKLVSTLLLASLVVVAPSCDGKSTDLMNDVQAAAEKGLDGLKDLDVSKLGADQMKSKATEISGMLGEQLGSIKDLASAETITKKIGPALEALTKLKDGLGGSLPDMSALMDTVKGLKDKFAGKADIMNVLKPILEKLTNLTK